MDEYMFRKGAKKPATRQVNDLPLFAGDPDPKPLKPEASLRDRFMAFHIKNPGIYLALETAALSYAKRGDKTGIAKLVEELRWDPRVVGVDATSPFKINNSYRAFYARLLIDHHPSLADVLEIRQQSNSYDHDG